MRKIASLLPLACLSYEQIIVKQWVGHIAVIKLVVLGAGLIGSRHARAIMKSDFCDIVGVVDPNSASHSDSEIRYFNSIEDIDEAVDGVIIATPTKLHLAHAELAIARGWHMLIEKPVTATPEEAHHLSKLMADTTLHCLVGHHRRYHPSIQLLRQWVRSGEIGQPITSNLMWAMRKPDAYFENNWRTSDGSPVMINLIHDIDLMRFVLGEVDGVTGLASNAYRGTSRVESGAIALRFESGLCATISFADSAISPWGFEAGTGENPNIGTTGQDMWWITGTSGSVSFPSLTRWGGAEDWSQGARARAYEADVTVPLDAQLLHFVRVISGQEAPLITVADAAASLAVTWDIETMLSHQINHQ